MRIVSGWMFASIIMASPKLLWAVELLHESFTYPNGLITNEYAYWNPTDPSSINSSIWELTSGSMFASGNQGWTGIPDDVSPNATSSNGTNSAVFRLTTKEADFGDVDVSFSLKNQGLSTSPSTPAVDWDGVHVFLRYQSEYNLYYASINRRDNTVVIKKKIPGGPSNGGTYYELSSYLPFQVPYGQWQSVRATVKNNTDGSVTIQLFENGNLLVSATDNGSIGGPPITHAGKVGIRGDNANLLLDEFVVSTLGTPPPPPPPPPANEPPIVNAGPDMVLPVNTWGTLAGTATDDGKPKPLTMDWSMVSGPATPVFQPNNNMKVLFTEPGLYTLRLTAYDGEYTRWDDVNITVPTPVETVSKSVVSHQTGRVLNRAAGQNTLNLSCSRGTPIIRTRLGQPLRQSLPEVGPNDYLWDGKSDNGQYPASGTYAVECGGQSLSVVFIRG